MKAKLKDIIDSRHDIWCVKNQNTRLTLKAVDTHYRPLNDQLEQGGWPMSVATELLCSQHGGGELSFLLPAIAKLSQAEKWVAFIAPPFTPYGPALEAAGVDSSRILMIHPRNSKELLWATEQALKAGTCSAVISWFGSHDIATKDLRRIQYAAKSSDCLHIQYRDSRFAEQPSPAKLRLSLTPNDGQLALQVLKQIGTWAGQQIELPIDEELRDKQCNVIQLEVPKSNRKNTLPMPSHSDPAQRQIVWQ
jgi:cell division inhibitor SulA